MLNNSVVINPQKLHRVRMPYKRLFSDRLDIVYPRICPDFLRYRVFQHPRLFSSLEIGPSFNLTSRVRWQNHGSQFMHQSRTSNTSVLSRLKDSKVMGVADEDAPEDPQRQETIVGGCAGESFRGVCVCEKGHPGEFK